MSEEVYTLPPGWKVTEFPSTIQVEDEAGKIVTEFPKPYERGHTLGELVQSALKELTGR